MYVITSKNSTVELLTKEQLRKLYLKKINTINGKKVYIINNKELYDKFTKVILNKTPNQIHAYWMKQIFLGKNIPPPIESSNKIQDILKNKKNSISYDIKIKDKKVIYEIK
jgi:ABC-type phosphate transport system substrate-binding protein